MEIDGWVLRWLKFHSEFLTHDQHNCVTYRYFIQDLGRSTTRKFIRVERKTETETVFGSVR